MILPIALPFLVLLFLVLVVVLIVMVELRILAYAYRKIGVRPRYVFAVLVLSLVGSYINIPLYAVPVRGLVTPETVTIYRSEEHTSELQSRVDLVCRLLLGKKKNTTNTSDTH